MIEIWLYSIISVFVVSVLSIVGAVILAAKNEFLNKSMHFLVSFAVGNLFGAAFIHLIPAMNESSELTMETGSKFIFFGIILFFIFYFRKIYSVEALSYSGLRHTSFSICSHELSRGYIA